MRGRGRMNDKRVRGREEEGKGKKMEGGERGRWMD